MMVVLLTLCATTFGLSLLFLLTTYLHRAVALAPLHWKKPLAVYYIIFSFLSNVIGICAIAYALNLCLSYNSVDPQFEAIRSFSEILYLEASFNVFLTNPALLPLCGIFLLTIIVTILLMYKFSVNASASKKTRQKQDLLFRLTLIQLFVLLTSIGLPALALFFSALGWLHLPEIFLFCIFAPLTMHSPGYCIAIICTPFYRKILRQCITVTKMQKG
ncbi:unnamed protein product, partial [Mesorhabditis belari]|uniref:Uncharacterized protein n=1 Tax=Mesorhabditis belari TaxID=2138241 RepID=A0AAF3F8U7_9BILA